MNRILAFSLGLIIVMLSACSASNDVVSNGWLQKRKHRSGWHFDGFAHKSNASKPISKKETLSIESDLDIAEFESKEEKEAAEPASSVQNEVNLVNSKHSIGIIKSNPLKLSKLTRRLKQPNIQTQPLDGIAPDEPEEDVHVMVVVSFGLMLLTLSIGFIPVLGFLLALAVLITATIGLKHSKDKTLGKLAFILGVILVLLALAYNIFIFTALIFL